MPNQLDKGSEPPFPGADQSGYRSRSGVGFSGGVSGSLFNSMDSFGFHDGNIYDLLDTRRFDARQVFSHFCDNRIIVDVLSRLFEFVF